MNHNPAPDLQQPACSEVDESHSGPPTGTKVFKDPRHVEAFHLLNQKLRDPAFQGTRKKFPTFLITLILFFAWLAWDSSDSSITALARLALFVGVILFHELGHFLAMKYFGYQDVTMFFIPFFGAAVSGRKTDVRPWQEVVMILAGPLPGILIGVPLLLLSPAGSDHSWMREIALQLIILNFINLIPIKPLDGGRFFDIVLFCRWRWTALLFGFLSWIGFAIFLLKMTRLPTIVVIILCTFQASVAWRRRKMRIKLQERDISSQPDSNGEASPQQALGLFRTIEDVFAPHRVSVANLAEISRFHLQTKKQESPGVVASFSLLAVYAATLMFTLAGVFGFGLKNPAFKSRMQVLWSRIQKAPSS